MTTKNIRKLQGGRVLDNELIGGYTRGRLTLKAMEVFPIEKDKSLAPTANLWLPVQAYYAVHGVGLAAMLALGQTLPKAHESFKAAFADLALRYLPPPFNAGCKGGPTVVQFVFENLTTTGDQVRQQSNLVNPKYADIDCCLGKCLATTREKLLEELFKKARRDRVTQGRKRRNLTSQEKNDKAGKLHFVTAIDFLYRMRIRSNYEEPDIHLFASDQQADEAVRHYGELLLLTKALVTSLSIIIRQKIGSTVMTELEGKFT
ncbi:MAG: hypothetical protein M0Z79_02010 [Nitrospiraceae bacterium]|nr:hypothetical protein [Nitrospiraceae bacterium]